MCRERLVNSFMHWLHFTQIDSLSGNLPWKLLQKMWWQAGSSAHTGSCCCPSLQPAHAFCTSPLPAQHTFVWAAVVENAFDFKYECKFDFICIRSGKRQIACEWSHVVLPTWAWLGGRETGAAEALFEANDPIAGLMQSKGRSGELRQPRLSECWCWS